MVSGALGRNRGTESLIFMIAFLVKQSQEGKTNVLKMGLDPPNKCGSVLGPWETVVGPQFQQQ